MEEVAPAEEAAADEMPMEDLAPADDAGGDEMPMEDLAPADVAAAKMPAVMKAAAKTTPAS